MEQKTEPVEVSVPEENQAHEPGAETDIAQHIVSASEADSSGSEADMEPEASAEEPATLPEEGVTSE